MSNKPSLDFSACEAELVHLPGAIQSCGALVATDLSSGRVTHVSTNLGAVFSRSIQPNALLGKAWSECVEMLGLTSACAHPPENKHPLCVQYLAPDAFRPLPVEVYAHAGPNAHIWEFHLAMAQTAKLAADWEARIFDADVHAHSLAQSVAEEVHALTGFSRVMVYYFAPDWSGEVVAEAREPNLIPYLGLHYPATDIPSQARQLYRENTLRTIPSVAAPPVPLSALASAPPLDLSQAILRAVSPYHLEYLANMGVAATLTLSIMVNGELWGMVACHHHVPYSISAATRGLCNLIVGRMGRWLTDQCARQALREAEWAERDYALLREKFTGSSASQLLARLFFGAERIDHLLEADAAVLFLGDTFICTGDTPDPRWLRACVTWINERPDPAQVVVMDRLPPGLLPPASRPESACGLLAASLTGGAEPITLILLRRETLRDVHWGGDPNRPATLGEDYKIGPRKSFARWSETVSGQSLSWSLRMTARFERILNHIRLTAVEEVARGARALAAGLLDAPLTTGIIGNRLIDNLENTVAILSHPERELDPHIELASIKFLELMGLTLGELEKVPATLMLKRLNLPPTVLDLGYHRLDAITPSLGARTYVITHRNFISVKNDNRRRRLTLLQFMDVTSDERLANAMRASNRQLAESLQLATLLAQKADASNRAKDEFLANMSHELRTPMNGVLGMASMLQHTELTEEQQEYVKVIISSGQNMVAIIGEILDLAKIEAHKIELESIEFEIRSLLAELEKLHSIQAKGKRIRLLFCTTAEVPDYLRGDPTRLRQIMGNLIGNALKFTSEGEVTVLTTLLSPGSSPPGTVGLRFAVRDTGIGIPEDRMDRLFNKFTQVDASTTRKFGGTGLGLAITKQLVELMGGHMGVTSQLGVGSEFWFTMHLGPCKGSGKPKSIPVSPTLSQLSSAQRGAHILVVEDNLINQQVVRQLLFKLGLRVTIAGSGEEALRVVTRADRAVDLILMDVQMPGMDGLECTRRLRDPANGSVVSNLPIIAVTANTMSGDEQDCLDAGMNGYLAKPINVASLGAILARWLPGG